MGRLGPGVCGLGGAVTLNMGCSLQLDYGRIVPSQVSSEYAVAGAGPGNPPYEYANRFSPLLSVSSPGPSHDGSFTVGCAGSERPWHRNKRGPFLHSAVFMANCRHSDDSTLTEGDRIHPIPLHVRWILGIRLRDVEKRAFTSSRSNAALSGVHRLKPVGISHVTIMAARLVAHCYVAPPPTVISMVAERENTVPHVHASGTGPADGLGYISLKGFKSIWSLEHLALGP